MQAKNENCQIVQFRTTEELHTRITHRCTNDGKKLTDEMARMVLKELDSPEKCDAKWFSRVKSEKSLDRKIEFEITKETWVQFKADCAKRGYRPATVLNALLRREFILETTLYFSETQERAISKAKILLKSEPHAHVIYGVGKIFFDPIGMDDGELKAVDAVLSRLSTGSPHVLHRPPNIDEIKPMKTKGE